MHKSLKIFEICEDINQTASKHSVKIIVIVDVQEPIFYSGDHFISMK